MKTIVQKLGLWGRRFLLATSLAFAGVVTASAETITFKSTQNLREANACIRIFQGSGTDCSQVSGNTMSYQGYIDGYHVWTYTADNINSYVGFGRFSSDCGNLLESEMADDEQRFLYYICCHSLD